MGDFINRVAGRKCKPAALYGDLFAPALKPGRKARIMSES
jgi:hypothetical protein